MPHKKNRRKAIQQHRRKGDREVELTRNRRAPRIVPRATPDFPPDVLIASLFAALIGRKP
ncbi:MAG: hypothetical protein GW948_02150 [Rhodobacterales bacterium]|nr:hypothetical protein [Rhodobacterales bacterium]